MINNIRTLYFKLKFYFTSADRWARIFLTFSQTQPRQIGTVYAFVFRLILTGGKGKRREIANHQLG
jgi:hypothetical protein